MSSHYLLNVSDVYCILCSYFILKNVAVHAAASVNIKDETWNSVFDRPHDASEDDIYILTFGVMLKKLPHHIIYCWIKTTITVMGEMQLNQKGIVRLNLNNAFRIRMMVLSL